MVVQTEKPTMDIEEFHSSPEYKILTEAQRVYLDALIETSDPLEAARRAYPRHRKDEHYLRVLLFKAEDSPRLQAAIAKAFGLSDREQTIRSLRRQVQRLDGNAKVNALTLLAQITGALPAGAPLVTAQAAETPADPAATTKGDVSVSVAPKPALDPFSARMFHHN